MPPCHLAQIQSLKRLKQGIKQTKSPKGPKENNMIRQGLTNHKEKLVQFKGTRTKVIDTRNIFQMMLESEGSKRN